jgi:hypothetical protein
MLLLLMAAWYSRLVGTVTTGDKTTQCEGAVNSLS